MLFFLWLFGIAAGLARCVGGLGGPIGAWKKQVVMCNENINMRGSSLLNSDILSSKPVIEHKCVHEMQGELELGIMSRGRRDQGYKPARWGSRISRRMQSRLVA
jgi:hypothetical protein